MAEEDEIDILGDYSLDGFLAGTNAISNINSELDILQCDYSMNSHNEWLLDSSSSCFYNDETTKVNERVKSISPPTVINVIATRPNVSKIEPILGWSTTEIVLLERGLELFGSSPVCLSQFIGSKTPSQVKQYLKVSQNKNLTKIAVSEVSLENTITNHVNLDVSEVKCNQNTKSIGDEVLDDVDIPASVEEVISIVSTAKTTVRKHEKKEQNDPEVKKVIHNAWRQKSVVKSNNSRSVLKPVFQKYLKKTSSLSAIKSNKLSIKESIIASMKQRFSKSKNIKNSGSNLLSKKTRLQRNSIIRNKMKFSEKPPYTLHLITGGGKALPISESEEVIKLENRSDVDSDTEIDIEVDDTSAPTENNTILNSSQTIQNGKSEEQSINCVSIDGCINSSDDVFEEETIIDDMDSINCFHEEVVITDEANESVGNSDEDSDVAEPNISIDLKKQLQSLEKPESEYIIDSECISELEKYFNSEFFDGRPTKTPERYLKIRNYMLSRWKSTRPNYLSKTQARHGLKNCGDVNSIGRIHSVLEQLGAINFNCDQTCYIRPMSDLFKNNSNIINSYNSTKNESLEVNQPVRVRKKNRAYANDSEGYTISHSQDNEMPKNTVRLRTHYKRNGGQLMNCSKFTESFHQPFEVHIEISALLSMNFHSITSRNEVMGLVGGIYCNEVKSKTLYVNKYQPCQTVQQTRIDCEMCPVSQSESVTAISNDGLSVVGWVHSHPGFPPLPSLQDLNTQKEMQCCFEKNGPFMGIIIGPHNGELRCLTIPNPSNDIPYEYEIKYKHDSKSIQNLEASLKNILEIVKSYSSDILSPNSKSPYSSDMRAVDKFLMDMKLIFNKLQPKLSIDEEEQIVNLIISTCNTIDNFSTA